MKELWANPLFGACLTIVTFALARMLNERLKTPLANPILIASLLCIGFLGILGIPVEDYQVGGAFIEMFLLPVTAILGLAVYRQREILKRDFFPVVIGCFVGSLTSIISTMALGKLFKLDEVLTASLIPKSVTTAIAIDLSEQLGGLKGITIMSVIICGVCGAAFHPLLIKLFKLDNKVARGVAIGTTSHSAGTTSALQLGEIEGAISGVSMGIAGISAVIIALFL
ncbi:putative murein hydrolase (TIGR00659 family) [Lachnospiraceae bacterium PF1-22]|uniref:LrgB family protein n=1 Tax=Ohessyouella blattaphilus TaxID=2949333 RepID=UPI003E1FB89F